MQYSAVDMKMPQCKKRPFVAWVIKRMPSFCGFLALCEKTRIGGFPGRQAADRGERILSNYIFRCLWHSERPVGMLHCPYRITSRIICSSKAFAWQQSGGWWLWPAVGIWSIWPGSAKWLQLGSLPQTIAIAIIQVSVGICPNRNIGRQRHSGGWWHTPAVGIRSIWPGSTKWLQLGSLPQTIAILLIPVSWNQNKISQKGNT